VGNGEQRAPGRYCCYDNGDGHMHRRKEGSRRRRVELEPLELRNRAKLAFRQWHVERDVLQNKWQRQHRFNRVGLRDLRQHQLMRRKGRIAMTKHANLIMLSCTAVLLLSGPALADHCSADLGKVQQRLSQPTNATANALEAAAGLVQLALTTCEQEAVDIAAAAPDDPIRQPDYITVGRSELMNALQLLSGQ
jgi:hypothetical protein